MFNIAPNTLFTMASVLSLLMIATCVRFALAYTHPNEDITALRHKTESWWILLLIFCCTLLFSPSLAIFLFAFLSFLALKELLSIIPTRQCDRRVIFLAYLSIPFQYYWVSIGWFSMFLIFIPVYMFLLLPIRLVLMGQTEGFIRSISIIQWSMMLTVFCLSHIAYLIVLPAKNSAAGSLGPLLFLIITTELNDFCQFIISKFFKQREIHHCMGRNKTWGGLLGSLMIISIISAFLAPFLTPLSHYQGFLIGGLISVTGFFGDIVISCIKSDLHIKKCSTILPGHTGIMDKIDSLIYTSPVFFYFLYYYCY